MACRGQGRRGAGTDALSEIELCVQGALSLESLAVAPQGESPACMAEYVAWWYEVPEAGSRKCPAAEVGAESAYVPALVGRTITESGWGGRMRFATFHHML